MRDALCAVDSRAGWERIRDERIRQHEGWTPEHDDGHLRGELALVATELIVSTLGNQPSYTDPWGLIEKHAADPVRRLEIAGALVAAEIDRLLRQMRRQEDARLAKEDYHG